MIITRDFFSKDEQKYVTSYQVTGRDIKDVLKAVKHVEKLILGRTYRLKTEKVETEVIEKPIFKLNNWLRSIFARLCMAYKQRTNRQQDAIDNGA